MINTCCSLIINVTRTCRSCFAMLRRIRAISSSLTPLLVKMLVVSLALFRLDYFIAAHAGLPKTTLWRLQRVLHAAARITCGSSRYDRVQPLLRSLNWLPIQGRIEHRLATIAFNCRKEPAPPYLSSELRDVASMPGRRCLRSSSSRKLAELRVRCPTLGGRAFPVTAARVWNALPTSITSLSAPLTFKSTSKSHFIDNFFNNVL